MNMTSKTLVIALMTAVASASWSCTGNKAEKTANETVEIIDEQETAVVAEDNRPAFSDAQKQALIGSSLVSEEDFGKAMFIDFNATWCGPCRQFAPYFEAAAKTFDGQAKFVSIDTDSFPTVAEAFGIESIPL